MRTLVFDPSGNFEEGKGTTGWAIFAGGTLRKFGEIQSKDFERIEEYWYEHLHVIRRWDPDIIVCESFNLQPSKAVSQSWSAMETPQLIGYMRMCAWKNGIPFILQKPSIKHRVNDEVLEHMGIVEVKNGKHYMLGRPSNLHMRDAVRHGVYFHRYNKMANTKPTGED